MTEKNRKKRTASDDSLLVAEVAKRVPSSYLHCRDLRHTWGITSPFEKADFTLADEHTEYIAYTRKLQCAVCGTVRLDTYTLHEKPGYAPRLERWSVSYRYPSGYHLNLGGLHREVKTNQILRYELLQRVLKETKAR